MAKKYITAKDAAALLRVTQRRVRQLVDAGILRGRLKTDPTSHVTSWEIEAASLPRARDRRTRAKSVQADR